MLEKGVKKVKIMPFVNISEVFFIIYNIIPIGLKMYNYIDNFCEYEELF